MKVLNTVDLFSGLGGATTGMEVALARKGYRHHGIAINHWRIAVATMLANHPDVDAFEMKVEDAIPEELVPSREVDLFWASPSCTHHSRAKGGRPRSNQLRAQPDLILPWIRELFVRYLIVENVPEFVEWGPLTKDGRIIKRLKGQCFRKWVESIEACNYRVEWRILNCADYGDATTRRRFFLQAVRKGCGRIVWPEPTHAEHPQPDLWGHTPLPWRGIRECLDLADTGQSIFNRKKPLAANTLRRVFAGLRKYCGLDFQMDFLGADGPDEARLRPLDTPLATQPAGGNRTALVGSFLVRFNRNGDAEPIDKPISVIAAGGQHHALCHVFIVRQNRGCFAEDAGRPLSSIQASTVHHALCQPVVIDHFRNGVAHHADEPVGAQPTHDRFSVVHAFVVDMSHPGDKNDAGRVTDGAQPLKTATARNNTAAAFLVTEQAGNAPRSADEPLRTQTAVRKDYVVRPLVLGQQSGSEARPADSPCPTISTSGAVRVVKPVPVAVVDMSRPAGPDSGHINSVDEPIRTITTFDNLQGVYLMTEDGTVVDIRMRMLKPSELAAAHSFPADYKITGNRSEQVKQIGNSVPVMTAAAICEAALGGIAS